MLVPSGLQLAVLAALLVLGTAFPAAEEVKTTDTAAAASEAAEAPAQTLAVQEDAVNSADGSGTKVNKKRSQVSEAKAYFETPRQKIDDNLFSRQCNVGFLMFVKY